MGIVKVLPQEHPGIRARNVDVTLPQGEAVDDPAALRRLALELASPGREPVVALRGRKRFVPELERVERSDSGSKGTTLLRSGGVYWITGGLGRLGVALAEHLARRHDARVVLLGRSPVPPKETWVDAGGALARIHDLEREVQRESAGVSAAIEVVSADMSDRARLGEVLDDTLARFGRLDGVIHAAGTTSGPAFRPVDELEPMHWDTFFDAKARGLFALEEVLRARSSEHDCRFVLLMSSIATLLGGLDFAAYAAANTFMNHFALARERASSPGPTWMSASWDGFRFDGGEGSVENRRALGRTVKDFALTADEGVEIFERLLGMASAPSVVVATSDPSARLAVWTTARAKGSGGAPTATTASSPSRSRPDVRSAFAPPRTELERSVVAIWEDVLGVEGVGLDDDFFELGGHSLSALQIVSAVSERFGIEVPIRRLFEAPTAAAIASLLQPSLEGAASSSSGGRGSAPPSIEDLLGSVEAMSEEEARELLAQSSRREPESDHDE